MYRCAPTVRSFFRRGFSVELLCTVFLVGWSAVAAAQDPLQIVRVEEDWELVVGTPDPNSDGPQVACVISPLGDVNSVHAALELNHQSLPEFVPGGIQLQVWNDETPENSRKFPNGAVMALPGETIRWTQSMELEDGTLTFEVIDGTSSTWGSFGGQGYLKASGPATLANLNGYDPEVSVKNSGIAYAANRVQSLVLRKVRLITATGEVLEDDTARPVHQQQ